MRKAVFLDRDGTINVDKHYLYRKEDFVFLPGAVEGMKILQKMGYSLIVITNQSGIARGFYTEKEYKELEEWMLLTLKEKGIEIAGVYYCPHLPDAEVRKYRCVCECRKPLLGMFWKAVKEHGIDIYNSIAMGDKERDLVVCNNGKTTGFLLYTDKQKWGNIHCIKGGILEAANMIKKQNERTDKTYY